MSKTISLEIKEDEKKLKSCLGKTYSNLERGRIAMKIFDSVKYLEDMLENKIKNIDNKIIKLLIAYDLCKRYF